MQEDQKLSHGIIWFRNICIQTLVNIMEDSQTYYFLENYKTMVHFLNQ